MWNRSAFHKTLDIIKLVRYNAAMKNATITTIRQIIIALLFGTAGIGGYRAVSNINVEKPEMEEVQIEETKQEGEVVEETVEETPAETAQDEPESFETAEVAQVTVQQSQPQYVAPQPVVEQPAPAPVPAKHVFNPLNAEQLSMSVSGGTLRECIEAARAKGERNYVRGVISKVIAVMYGGYGDQSWNANLAGTQEEFAAFFEEATDFLYYEQQL